MKLLKYKKIIVKILKMYFFEEYFLNYKLLKINRIRYFMLLKFNNNSFINQKYYYFYKPN